MVVTALPLRAAARVGHARAGEPAIRTVHAPHCPSPQPYSVPVRFQLIPQHGQEGAIGVRVYDMAHAVDQKFHT